MQPEMMPAKVRASGFSLAYSLATALFGGFIPPIATHMIQTTYNNAMPGVSLSTALRDWAGRHALVAPAVPVNAQHRTSFGGEPRDTAADMFWLSPKQSFVSKN